MANHGQRKTEDVIAGLAVGKKLVDDFSHVAQSHYARVVDLSGQRRRDDVAGVEARELLLFLVFPVCNHVSERFQRTAEAAFGSLGGFRDTADLAVGPREQRDQEVRFMKRVSAKNQSFRLLRHGEMLYLRIQPGRSTGRRSSGEQSILRHPSAPAAEKTRSLAAARPSKLSLTFTARSTWNSFRRRPSTSPAGRPEQRWRKRGKRARKRRSRCTPPGQ